MIKLKSIKYRKNLAEYFATKPLYLDDKDKKLNTRKLIEEPWQYYKLQEPNKLLNLIKNIEVFTKVSEQKDYFIYQKFIVENTKKIDRINSIWLLFGLHIGNGENFSYASGLIKQALPLVVSDFGETSYEFVKVMYFFGWTREKMDDLIGASDSYSKVRNLIIDSNITECAEFLKLSEKALLRLNE